MRIVQQRKDRKPIWALCALLLAPSLLPMAQAASSAGTPSALAEMSLEELMSIEVTSVSKKAEPLSSAAAAIYVITRADIRRCGATTIADALRLAPGLQVARTNANKWAVTSRGFSGDFANKLLVLIDGRSVYTPLFSGVFWDVQDVMLEDIQRIEVIRGPGAALWGANAVNGVINIITQAAENTQGGVLAAGGGSEERGFGALRYGSAIGNDTFLRVYGTYANRDNSVGPEGTPSHDDWDIMHAGFRLDRTTPGHNSVTVQGDIYDGTAGETHAIPVLTPPYVDLVDDQTRMDGGYLLARYTHHPSCTSDLALQLYFDRTRRHNIFNGEERSTLDLDVQHRFRVTNAVEGVYGFGYRVTSDEFDSTSVIRPDVMQRTDNLPSAFIQGEASLFGDLLRVTVGSKFEHNDYTGFEYQPSGRVLWLPHERHAAWAAVSRAVRTPSRYEHDVKAPFKVLPPDTRENPTPVPIVLTAYGDDSFDSEVLLAYEAGYRVMPLHKLFVDIATFYNAYSRLRTGELGYPFVDSIPSFHLILPFRAGNDMEGETYGAELAVDWQARDWLRLRAAYTHLQMDLRLLAGSDAQPLGEQAGASPEHQLSLRAALDVTADIDLDLWLRYVDILPELDIDSYVELDARLAWRPHPRAELALVGQNLLQAEHAEFRSEVSDGCMQIQRGAYASATWRF